MYTRIINCITWKTKSVSLYVELQLKLMPTTVLLYQTCDAEIKVSCTSRIITIDSTWDRNTDLFIWNCWSLCAGGNQKETGFHLSFDYECLALCCPLLAGL